MQKKQLKSNEKLHRQQNTKMTQKLHVLELAEFKHRGRHGDHKQ